MKRATFDPGIKKFPTRKQYRHDHNFCGILISENTRMTILKKNITNFGKIIVNMDVNVAYGIYHKNDLAADYANQLAYDSHVTCQKALAKCQSDGSVRYE